MKIICIDASVKSYTEYPNTSWDIKEGEIYTIRHQKEFSGILAYSLNECPNELYYWAAERFIPLSEINEPKLESITETEKV